MTLAPPGLGALLTVAALIATMGLFAAMTRSSAHSSAMGVLMMMLAAVLTLIAFDTRVALADGAGAHRGADFALLVVGLIGSFSIVMLSLIWNLRAHTGSADPPAVEPTERSAQ